MLKNLIIKNPLTSYFILAMAVGASIIVLAAKGIIPSSIALASVFSASFSGVILTAVVDGRAGLLRLFRRLSLWRVGVGYWLFSVLCIVPIYLLGSMFNSLFGGDSLVYSHTGPILMIVPLFIGFFIISGLGQELGWTGFLLTRLQSRHNALASGVLRGFLVGAWHLPLLLYSNLNTPAFVGFPYGGWIADEGFLIAFTVLVFMFAIPWSIFFTWIFNSTGGSLLLVAILHGSEIWVAYLMMMGGINPNNINNYWGYGAIMILVALVIVIVTGAEDLSRKCKRIRY
jgi:membrane protease YdiL (CAAX protease family)